MFHGFDCPVCREREKNVVTYKPPRYWMFGLGLTVGMIFILVVT